MESGSFAVRPCAFQHAQAVEARSRHAFPRHSHDSYGIGLIISGAQRSWSGRGTVEAGRGNIITCNPGEVHDGVPIGGTREWRMLYFAPALVGTVVADIRDGVSADFEFADPVIDKRAPVKAFEAAYEALTDRCADPGRAQERLILLLAGLLQHKRPSSVPVSPELARAKQRVDDDPTSPITLAELALEAGMSRFQVVRGFAKFTGLTPHAYIVQRRLDAARVMIAGGAVLADVAAACGFADQSHFNRAFVQRYGVTPGAYAEAMRRPLQFRSISRSGPHASITSRGHARPVRTEGRQTMRPTRPPEGESRTAGSEPPIRQCREDEAEAVLAIINSAAEVYRGAIPLDCWHEPYMSAAEFQSEIATGITFMGCEVDGVLAGVMGIQAVRNVNLIRHAYVLRAYQGRGIGSALIERLRAQTTRQLLVGTWTAATWAVGFYEQNGFQLVPDATKVLLLRTYWTVSERQIETSVVLAAPRLTGEQASKLVERADRR